MSVELAAVREQLLGLLGYTAADEELEAVRDLLAAVAELGLPPELEAPPAAEPAVAFSPLASRAVEG